MIDHPNMQGGVVGGILSKSMYDITELQDIEQAKRDLIQEN